MKRLAGLHENRRSVAEPDVAKGRGNDFGAGASEHRFCGINGFVAAGEDFERLTAGLSVEVGNGSKQRRYLRARRLEILQPQVCMAGPGGPDGAVGLPLGGLTDRGLRCGVHGAVIYCLDAPRAMAES